MDLHLQTSGNTFFLPGYGYHDFLRRDYFYRLEHASELLSQTNVSVSTHKGMRRWIYTYERVCLRLNRYSTRVRALEQCSEYERGLLWQL